MFYLGSLERVLVSAHGSLVLTNNGSRKVLSHKHMVQLGHLDSLVIVQRVTHVYELLQKFLLLTLALSVLFFPSSCEFLVQCSHLVLMFYDEVIDFNFDTIPSLLKESFGFPFCQFPDFFRYPLNLRVAMKH